MLKILFLAYLSILYGCTRYSTAKSVKLIGFSENISKGKTIGQIEGDDCVFIIFGYRLGGYPTVMRAIANTQQGRRSEFSDSFGGKSNKGRGQGLRYINNLRVEPTGFNYYLFGKDCISVTGIGYK